MDVGGHLQRILSGHDNRWRRGIQQAAASQVNPNAEPYQSDWIPNHKLGELRHLAMTVSREPLLPTPSPNSTDTIGGQ